MRGSWRPNRTATYWPPNSYGHNSVSFPFSWAAQPGAWGSSLSGTWSSFQYLLSNWSEALNSNCLIGSPEVPLCWVLVLSTASYLQLTDFLSSPGLYNCSTPTFFLQASQFRTQFNPSTVKVISWYSSAGCTCYLHGCIFYFDSLAGSEVNMQTVWWHINHCWFIWCQILFIHVYSIYMIHKHILLFTFLNESKLILLHKVIWFQVLLCITNNSFKHQSFVYA